MEATTALIDPTFGEIQFQIDAWNGLVSFPDNPSGTREFAVHIGADESGPTPIQRATFDQLKARYSALWPSIAEALLGCQIGLSSTGEVARTLGPVVGCYIEDGGGRTHADFELVYTFDRPGENGRGYFIRIVGWEIAEAFVAE